MASVVHRTTLSILVTGALVLIGLVPDSRATPAANATHRPTPDPAAGQAAYQQSCARCHGMQGKGDGVDAKRFYPRPRDFTVGTYKFRTTTSGTPPSDDDLFATITNGLPGTNMPDWRQLSEETRWQLVDYLKSFAPQVFQQESTPVTLPVFSSNPKANTGRAAYDKYGCAACHGKQGRANGRSSATLVDDWGMPIRPANLTQGWAYRGGNSPTAIATRFLTGIDGTGMPSYVESGMTPEETWQLAYYVASLQEPAHWNMIVHAHRIDGELPTTVDDPRWQAAERTDVRLRNVVTPAGEWANPPTVRAATFQVVYNEEQLGLLVSWDDPSESRNESPDALAVILEPASVKGDVVTLQAWPYAGAPPLDLCYWSAPSSTAYEGIVSNYEQIQTRPPSAAELHNAARFDDGRWRLLLRRSLTPHTPQGAAALTADVLTPMAFAVWDGGNHQALAVSPWVDVALERARHPAHH